MNKTLKANISMLLAAMIWGAAFVTQRMGMDSMGPFYFNGLRALLGAAVLILVALITDKTGLMKSIEEENASIHAQCGTTSKGEQKKTLFKGGIACGLVLFLSSNSQQIGLVYIDASKSGFLTALYIVLVPLIGIALRKPIHSNHLIAAALGVFGLYFLCINGSFNLQLGDLISIIGAFFWAVHILVTDHFAPKLNPIKLTAVQFFICGTLSIIAAPISGENLTLAMIADAKFVLLYTGIVSTAIAFSLQAFAQRYANATAASIILSTEALFATISGFLFLGEVFTRREFIGAIFMLAAVIIAQITFKDLINLFKKGKKHDADC